MREQAQPPPEPAATGETVSFDQQQRALIAAELARILNSEAFQSSRRCREFLQFIVERKLDGRDDQLKERSIGVELFGRSPDYEPTSDAIVRVRATEVRKRLISYYDHLNVPEAVRIELPSGSYVPEFRLPPQEPDRPAAGGAGGSGKWPKVLRLAGVAALIAAALGVWRMTQRDAPALARFWNAAINSAKPVLICLRQPVVYHIRYRVHEPYLKNSPPGYFPSPYVLPLKPGDIQASDLVPVPDQYVSIGCARAASRLSAMLAERHKLSQVRSGEEFSFVDLKDFPTVMVGAVPHEWTIKLTEKLPLVFVQENGLRGVREQDGARRTWWVPGIRPDGKTNEDYAIVTRMVASQTSELFVALAGVTQYGTDAASEFITSESELAAALSKTPRWDQRNLQILLHLDVVGKTPGKPAVIAVKTW